MKLIQYALGILLLALPTVNSKAPIKELTTLQEKLTTLKKTINGLDGQLKTLHKTIEDRKPHYNDVFAAIDAGDLEALKEFRKNNITNPQHRDLQLHRAILQKQTLLAEYLIKEINNIKLT